MIPTRAACSRPSLFAFLVVGLLLAAAPAQAQPVTDHGSLIVFGSSNVLDPYSFTTDGVSDFSGGSDAASNNVTYDRVNQARWGEYATGHVDLMVTAEAEQEYDYGIYGDFRAQSHTYHATANLLHGFDERYTTFGLTDIYQWRYHYVFDFDFEIRWHLTTRGIEPKLRSISGPAYTTAYFCQKLISLQGGCASSSGPGNFDTIGTRTIQAEIRRADGTGDWTLYVSFRRGAGVGFVAATYSFPLLGDQKDVALGSITVSLENETPCCEKTSVDQATVTLIRQSDYLRTKGSQESQADYQAYLDARTSFTVESRDIAPGGDGTVTFDNLPLYGLGRRSTSTPFWYSARISGAQTEEIDISRDPVDPNITATTFFIPELNTNLRPSTAETPPVNNFLITPTDALGAKLVLIPEVRRRCTEQYKAAEDTMQAGLDAYLASPGTLTAANIEGIKRVLWAERVVRAAADYANDAVDVALSGAATVLGDIFDDVTDFKRGDLKKRASEREAMEAAADKQPVNFYANLGSDKNAIIEAAKLDVALVEGQIAGVIKGVVKVLKQTYVDICIDEGLDAEECKEDAGHFTLAVVTVLNAISSRTIAGTAKAGIKAGIEAAVEAAKGPYFDGYCIGTASDLSTAVTNGLAWSAFSEDDYREDAAEVAELLRELSSAATRIGKAQAIQIVADGLDRTGDALEVVGTVGKPAEVLAKALKGVKYLYNVTAIVLPMSLVVRAKLDVEEGTLAAFGQNPPTLTALESRTMAAVHASGGVTVSALDARADSLMAAEFAIRQALGNDDIPGTMQALADTSDPDAYVNHLAAWTLEIERFKATVAATQATGTVADLLASFVIADVELKLANAELLAELRELLVAVDTVTYASPTARDYLVHRNSINSQLFLIRNKLQAFVDIAATLDAALGGQPVTPFIFSRVTSLVSLDTGEEMITQSPDELELTVQLENVGITALNDIKARLIVRSPKGSISMLTPGDVTIGTLAGGATTDATWRFDYDGDLSGEVIGLRVELLENDEVPVSFDFNEPHAGVFVDPAISDQDGDDMPDDWEEAHGLDTTSDDSAEDFDFDGLTNLGEYRYGLDPADDDCDDDTLSDGDELRGVNKGFLSDPLDPDTDADLVNDGADGQPLDASITASSPPVPMGQLQLSTDTVVLTSTNRFETVGVTNVGPGTMTWSTSVDRRAVVLATPADPKMATDDGKIGLTVPSYFDFDQPYRSRATVHVFDVAYPDNAPQEISVIVVGDDAPLDSTTTTVMSSDVCGDLTGDGNVTASDALATLQAAVALGSCALRLCDVNGDGQLTVTDALILLQFAVGVPVTLDCVG